MYQEVIKELRRSYDGMVDVREASALPDWKSEERSRFLQLLRAGARHTLLEFGAGTGLHGRFFQDEGIDVICTDLSPAMVEACRAKGLKAEVADFLSLDFPPSSLDAAFGMNCLLHVPRDELPSVLSKLRDLLVPGGLLYAGQYGGIDRQGTWPDDTYEPKRFFSYLSDDALMTTAETLFEVVDFRTIAVGGRGELHYQALIARKLSA
jgi:SAM-dependent methyltransferase